MSGNSEPTKFKNPVLNWIEFRLPIISYFQKEYGEYPMPKNCNYFWSFGALASILLVVLIISLKNSLVAQNRYNQYFVYFLDFS